MESHRSHLYIREELQTVQVDLLQTVRVDDVSSHNDLRSGPRLIQRRFFISGTPTYKEHNANVNANNDIIIMALIGTKDLQGVLRKKLYQD